MIRYGICLLAVVLVPLTAFAQFTSTAALIADLAAGRATQVDVEAWYQLDGKLRQMYTQDTIPKGKLYLTGLQCNFQEYGTTPTVGTVKLVGPFRTRSGQPVAMYAKAIGYDPDDSWPVVLQQNFAEPLYYDNSDGDGKESLAFELSPSFYERRHSSFGCYASVVVYDKSSPTSNPGLAPGALGTMYLKTNYDKVINMSGGRVSIPAGQYRLKNISCRGSSGLAGWSYAGMEVSKKLIRLFNLNRLWKMPASVGRDGSFQVNYNIPGLIWIKSTGVGDSSHFYVWLNGLIKNGECSVSLEQYGWRDSPVAGPKACSLCSTTEGFVTAVYKQVLRRDPDAGGLTYWVSQINSGRNSREGFLQLACSSPEYQGLVASTGTQAQPCTSGSVNCSCG